MTRPGPLPFTLWLTGLPCIGKTTTAGRIHQSLAAQGIHTTVLDSDDLAPHFKGLTKGDARARDIISRAMAVSALALNQSGISCICAATSPRRAIRNYHREMIPGYVEIWCKGSVETARTRDEHRLYDMADTGFIEGFTGVDEPYEPPEAPDLVLDLETLSPEACARTVRRYLRI